MSEVDDEMEVVPDPPTPTSQATSRAKSDYELSCDVMASLTSNLEWGGWKVVGECTDAGSPAFVLQTDDGLYRVRVHRLR